MTVRSITVDNIQIGINGVSGDKWSFDQDYYLEIYLPEVMCEYYSSSCINRWTTYPELTESPH